MPLHAYGENSFTFLLFQAIDANDLVRRVLLPSLRHFKKQESFLQKFRKDIPDDGDLDVWLFPNFGKKDGFGEPDALMLFGPFSFWLRWRPESISKERRRI